jgi:hypothetical protein
VQGATRAGGQKPSLRDKLKDIWAYVGRKTSVIQALLSYVLGRFLDRLFIRPHELHAQALRGEIDRPGTEWRLVVFYFGIAAGIVIVSSYAQRRMRTRGARRLSFGAASLAMVCAAMLGGTLWTPRVSDIERITGRVLDRTKDYYLFTRPLSSAAAPSCWLQSPAPLLIDDNGRFQLSANFSGYPGERFEILLIGGGAQLRSLFTHPGEYDCAGLLSDIPRISRVVEVK